MKSFFCCFCCCFDWICFYGDLVFKCVTTTRFLASESFFSETKQKKNLSFDQSINQSIATCCVHTVSGIKVFVSPYIDSIVKWNFFWDFSTSSHFTVEDVQGKPKKKRRHSSPLIKSNVNLSNRSLTFLFLLLFACFFLDSIFVIGCKIKCVII